MPLNKVNKIELNEGNTISLEVSVDGFEVGAPIEISGQATQINGAVATFYDVQTVPQPNDDKQTVVTVKSVNVSSEKSFEATDPITVVARAAEVWITTLDQDGAFNPRVSSGVQAAWKMKSFDYAIGQPSQHPAGWPAPGAP
ncbi:MAG TPA: hypothetical protein VGH77_20220 [Streptosporangiaceae bacterium]|jgi:hypothetical protein